RVPAAGVELLGPAWDELRAQRPDVEQMFPSPDELHAWLLSARELVERYFQVENPQRLEPAEREKLVEVELASGILLRGFVDRLDVAPDGAVRVVDRSEEHTSELQSRENLVCRLLLEKK